MIPITGTNIPKYQSQPVSRNGRFFRHKMTAVEMAAKSTNARQTSRSGWPSGGLG